MRLLVTKGPHKGQELDFGTAQGATALREGWAVMPFQEAQPAGLHHDQVIPGFCPATVAFVEGLPRLEANEEVVPCTPTPSDLAPAIARAIAGEPEPAATDSKRRKRG